MRLHEEERMGQIAVAKGLHTGGKKNSQNKETPAHDIRDHNTQVKTLM
jgi:hypothetical protein